MTYAEKLQDPRWKAKRLPILKRDNYSCQYCGEKTNLHVHHFCYNISRLPWDVEDDALITLCKDCHKIYHSQELFTPLEYELIGILRLFNEVIPGVNKNVVNPLLLAHLKQKAVKNGSY